MPGLCHEDLQEIQRLYESWLDDASGHAVKRLEKGDIHLQVSSEIQSRCLLKLSSLAGCPVLGTQ